MANQNDEQKQAKEAAKLAKKQRKEMLAKMTKEEKEAFLAHEKEEKLKAFELAEAEHKEKVAAKKKRLQKKMVGKDSGLISLKLDLFNGLEEVGQNLLIYIQKDQNLFIKFSILSFSLKVSQFGNIL